MTVRRSTKRRSNQPSARFDPFRGGGRIAELLRAIDWSKHPLGPPEEWPQSLRTAVRIMLNSRYPMFVWWGPQLFNLYNDAYIAVLGQRHPQALAQPAQETWREIWNDVGPLARRVIEAGESTWNERHLLMMERHGFREETYFTFSYSPVPDDTGGVGGVTCTCTEETERVVSDRRMTLLRELASDLTTVTAEKAVWQVVQPRLRQQPDLPLALIYMFEGDSTAARRVAAVGVENDVALAPPEISAGAEDTWPLAQVYQRNETLRLTPPRAASVTLLDERRALEEMRVIPLSRPGQAHPSGALVIGLNPYRPFDAQYQGFLELLAGQLAGAVAGARAFEDERRRAESLAELDRAKTTFFSNISHEFRTPLTLMIGPLEQLLLAGSGDLSTESREQLKRAHRNGLRLLGLVNSLLEFARIEAGRATPTLELVDLSTLTKDLAGAFRSVMDQAGLDFVVRCEPLPAAVAVDRTMWERIVFNLLSNAYKFTFSGRIEVSLQAVGPDAELRISDTGTGIAPEELPRLFSRFHRIPSAPARTHEGSGIGLALVQELARLLGGEVSVESELGRGSTFRVRLPLPDPGEAEPMTSVALPPVVRRLEAELYFEAAQDRDGANGEPAIPASPADRPMILVVDDNADMRSYLRELLTPHYDVRSATDGEAALAMLRQSRPQLVVSDIMMPRLDGMGLLRAIRADETLATLPVILLTARAGAEDSVEGFQADADDYLTKPFTAAELLARVGAHLKLTQVREEALQLSRQEAGRMREAAFIGQLSGELALLATDAEIIRVATRRLGEFIGAQRCYFLEAPADGSCAVHVADDWRANAGLPALEGSYDMRDFGGEDWWRAVSERTTCIADVADHPLTQRFADRYAHIGVKAFATAPFTRSGRWVASLSVTDDRARHWGEPEMRVLENVVARVWPLVERARSERMLQQSQRELIAALGQLPAAVYTCDCDDRVLYFNVAAVELFGRSPAPGESSCEHVRILEPSGVPLPREQWPMTICLRGGRASRGEEFIVERADGSRRYVRIYPETIRDAGGRIVGAVNVLLDVTEQSRRQRHEALLNQLSQHLALVSDPIEMVRYSTCLLGEYLGGSRCYFIEPGAEPDEIVVAHDWHRSGMAPVRGRHRRGDFGTDDWWHAYRARQLLISDVETDELTRAFAASYRPLQVRAYALCAFIRDSGWVVSLAVAAAEPRIWRTDELSLLQDVTSRVWPLVERARADAARRETEGRFRNMADHSPVMMWVTDANGRCTYLNRMWYEFTGQKKHEALGYGWLDPVHDDDREATRAAFLRSTEAGTVYRQEFRMRRVDGAFRWMLDAAVPRYSATGEFLGFIGSIIDITERKQEELSAHARAERLRLALSASNSGDWSWDADTDIVTLSPRAADIFGVAPGPVITWTVLRGLLEEQDSARAARAVEQALAARTDYDIEYRIARPSGGFSWVAARGRGVYRENGQVAGMLGVLQEINGRKLAEQALLEREQRMNRLMSLMPAGIYACDGEGRIIFFNRRAAELWGREPAINSDFRAFGATLPEHRLDGSPLPLGERPMVVALREARSFREAESIVVRPDGRRWVASVNIDPLLDAEGRPAGAINVFLDVTERKRDEQLAAGQNRALQALAAGEPLPEVLDRLVATAEAGLEGATACILLINTTTGGVDYGAGRRVPAAAQAALTAKASGEFIRQVQAGEVLETAGWDGAALWRAQQTALEGTELVAGWTTPILGSGGEVVGALLIYLSTARRPAAHERAMVAPLVKTAAVAIERRRAEEAVLAAERQLRLVTDSAPVMLTKCDAERRITFANRAYLERRGRTIDEVMGQPLLEVVGPEVYEKLRPYIDLALAGVRVDFEIEVDFPRVGLRSLSVSYVPEREADGHVRGWVSAISDITENRLADTATRQLAAIVESSEDAIISKDLSGRIMSWNRGAERLFGYRAEEMVGQPVTRLIPADRLDEEPALIGGLIKGRLVDHFETVRRRKDGSLIDVSLTISPIRDGQGRTIGASKIARDITQRRRQEAELRRREQLYRAIGESIDFGVWVSDAAGQLVYASDSFLRLVGLTQEEAAGNGWRQVLDPEERRASEASWQESLRRGVFWEQEHRVRGRDGAWHPVLTRGVPVRDEQGTITSWVGTNLDISAFKAAQEAVRQGEARFREIADNIPLFAWMANAGGKIFWFNRRWHEYTGLSERDFENGEGGNVVHPDHRQRVRDRYHAHFQEGKIWEDTLPLRRHDGTYRWFLSRAVPIRDEAGRTLRWFGTNTDITDLRSAQEVLRQRSQTLETLNRVGNALVAELDLTRILQTVTDAGCEITGAAAGAFYYNRPGPAVGSPGLSAASGAPAVFERLQARHGALFQATFTGDQVVRVADLHAMADGTSSRAARPVEVRSYLAVPVISRLGDVLGGLFFGHPEPEVFTEASENILRGLAAQAAIALDNANLYAALQRELAQQKRADAALRASERQLRLVTDHATVFLVLLDRNHRYKFINRPYAQRYGKEPHDVLGLRVVDLVGPAAYEAMRPNLEEAFAGKRVGYELEIPYDALGPRWMHIVYVPERNPDGEVVGLLAVMNDITERKQVEREVEVARDRAVAASRAKDEFLAALSHELRTPLNPVLLLASEAADDASLSGDVRATFATIRNNVELEARLIDDLLDLTRIARGKLPLDMQVQDAHALLQAALTTVRTDINEKQIQLVARLTALPSEVWGDAVRLQQIFWNVLKNAVKFTPPHGSITLQTTIEGESRLVVAVTDTGIGLEDNEIDRVFDAFVQGDHAGGGGSHQFGGIGLGLAISRMLVEQHFGEIRAESAGRDRGATFIITLPLARNLSPLSHSPAELAVSREPTAPPFLLPPEAMGQRLLLVEDHEPTRQTLAQLLARRGFQVTSVGTLSAARQAAAERPFDLLISDIGLPDGSGYALISELSSKGPIVGIALSGYGMDEDVARSRAAGFRQHLTKPVRVQSLDRALAELSRGR